MILKNFIVFEGIDGAGTTTQLNLLAQNEKAHQFLFTAEPTSCSTGQFLRQVLSGKFSVTNETMAFLFSADRCEHINGPLVLNGRNLVTGVFSAIQKGAKVVSDRYFFSSLAYQSEKCGIDFVRKLNSSFPLPSLLFYFCIEPEIALKRIQARNSSLEIFEKLEFQKKVCVQYEKVLNEFSAEREMKIIRLDATENATVLAQKIWSQIEKLGI